jgi:Tfp pilus assembly major pilin PilA
MPQVKAAAGDGPLQRPASLVEGRRPGGRCGCPRGAVGLGSALEIACIAPCDWAIIAIFNNRDAAMTKFRSLATLLVLMALFACGREAGDSSSVPLASESAQATAFGAGPWLRDRLPADTIVYARLPSPWRSALGPAGKATDRMFQSQAYVDAVARMRADLGKDPLSGEVAVPLTGLLYRLGSPIEIAVVVAGRIASPAANVYATLTLDYADAAALGKVLGEAMGGTAPTFDAEGYASLPDAGAPVFLHFDAVSKRLSVLGGMFANLDSLKSLRKEIAEAKVEPRAELALEREIDAHGDGMLIWADVEALRPLLSAGVADEAARKLLDQTKRIALGWGSVDGHGRLGLRAEISGAAWAAYLPQTVRKLDLDASGRTRMLVSAGWLTGADIKRIEAQMKQDPDLAKGWAETDAKLAEISGLHIADVFAPFGPDLAAFADDAGEFMAIRLADAAALQKLLDALDEKFKATHVVTEHAGQKIHHLRLPSMLEIGRAIGNDAAKPDDHVAAQIYARAGSHLYWIEQDGWLIMAGVPQPLMDRLALGADQPLDQFLRAAGGDSTALFAAAAVVNDAARRTYHGWLGVLASIADLGGVEVDLMALPTARQLALPSESAIGANLQLTPTRLQIDLNYAQHPMEWIGGSDGLTVVAVGGILAAIAIPAYQDYTLRAEVAAALLEAAALKVAIAEYYVNQAELPVDAEALGLELPLITASGNAEIDLDNGAIIVRFSDSIGNALAGKYLYLLPAQQGDNSLTWLCGAAADYSDELLVEMSEDTVATDIDARYLPVACRAGEAN